MKAILFDLDGTLLNTLSDLAAAMNHTLCTNNLPTHPVDAYRRFAGNGIRRLVERALPADTPPHLIDALYQQMFTYYTLHSTDTTAPYDGIPALIQAAQQKKYPLAILSNKAHPITTNIISRLFPPHTFAVIQGATPELPLKPDPTAALHIATTLAIPPSDILYLGDTSTDMQTANAAGMHPVGCTWGFRTEQELLNAGAKQIIHHPTQLIPLL